MEHFIRIWVHFWRRSASWLRNHRLQTPTTRFDFHIGISGIIYHIIYNQSCTLLLVTCFLKHRTCHIFLLSRKKSPVLVIRWHPKSSNLLLLNLPSHYQFQTIKSQHIRIPQILEPFQIFSSLFRFLLETLALDGYFIIGNKKDEQNWQRWTLILRKKQFIIPRSERISHAVYVYSSSCLYSKSSLLEWF